MSSSWDLFITSNPSNFFIEIKPMVLGYEYLLIFTDTFSGWQSIPGAPHIRKALPHLKLLGDLLSLIEMFIRWRLPTTPSSSPYRLCSRPRGLFIRWSPYLHLNLLTSSSPATLCGQRGSCPGTWSQHGKTQPLFSPPLQQ